MLNSMLTRLLILNSGAGRVRAVVRDWGQLHPLDSPEPEAGVDCSACVGELIAGNLWVMHMPVGSGSILR